VAAFFPGGETGPVRIDFLIRREGYCDNTLYGFNRYGGASAAAWSLK